MIHFNTEYIIGFVSAVIFDYEQSTTAPAVKISPTFDVRFLNTERALVIINYSSDNTEEIDSELRFEINDRNTKEEFYSYIKEALLEIIKVTTDKKDLQK